MKKFSLFLLFIFTINHECESQVNKIKKQMQDLFYELTIPTTKYDARKLFHSSDNFSDIGEIAINANESDLMILNFKENSKLSFLKNATQKSIQLRFKKGTDENTGLTIELYYSKEFANTCSEQFQEVINYYKPISVNSETNPIIIDSVKKGEMFYAYSSNKSFQKQDSYIIITTKFEVIGKKIIGLPPGEYYNLSISFYPSYFY